MERNFYHVIPVQDGSWSVIRSGALKAIRVFVAKADAVSFGRQLSSQHKGKLVVHRKDGTIQNATILAKQ